MGKSDWNENIKIIKEKITSIDLDAVSDPSLNYDLDEMEVIGDWIFSAAVPYDAPKQLKKNVLAALKAVGGNYQSIDYVLKRFGDIWVFPDPPEEKEIFYRILRELKQEIESIINSISSYKSVYLGERLARNALVRLKASFRSSTLLISQGYFFEPTAICRLILEQIAWAYSIYEINDKEKISNLKPTKAISKLKKLVRYSGSLYGTLNIVTHIDPEYDHDYSFETEDGIIFINYTIPDKIFLVLYFLLINADIFRIASEYIFRYYDISLRSWEKNKKGEMILVKDRPLNKEIKLVSKKLFKD